MRYYSLVASFFFVLQSVFAQSKSYDVCIYGGTSAGVIAARQAADMGKSVILIVPDGHIGGMATGGLGKTDTGKKYAIGGRSREFYRQLGAVYGKEEAWQFEPKAAAALFDEYLDAPTIEVVKDQRIDRVTKLHTTIQSVTLVPTYGEPRVTQVIAAKMFIDCTYEGDLMPLAGVSYTLGRESNRTYRETLNGVHFIDYLERRGGRHQFPDGVSPYITPGDPSSALVWGVTEGRLGESGGGDQLIQAYNFRICLTDSVENQLPITRPADYDSTKYELLARLFRVQPELVGLNDYFIWSKMPNRKTDINNRGGFSTDMIGANQEWPEGSFETRKRIYDAHVSYTKGLLYFMATDPRVPENLRREVKKWGYPKDEFVSTGHFTPQLYIREARRLVGEGVLTQNNCQGKVKVDDPIGMGSYPMDSHNTQRIIINGMVKNEGNVEKGGFDPYPISYRTITPKREECTNLLVPVCLSTSHIAFGSVRMEPVFMILGESAAVAAVQAINEGNPVQEIDYGTLKAQLEANGQVLQLANN